MKNVAIYIQQRTTLSPIRTKKILFYFILFYLIFHDFSLIYRNFHVFFYDFINVLITFSYYYDLCNKMIFKINKTFYVMILIQNDFLK